MNQEQYAKLTDEEKRVKVAELCEWLDVHVGSWWMDDCGNYEIRTVLGYKTQAHKEHNAYTPVPDYLHDLNACHEFEKMLEYKFGYDKCLSEIVMEDTGHGYTWHATAAQKCKAFVLTMEE